MSLVQTISDELKAAMKSGDTAKRDTLRLLQSALKNAAIDTRKEIAEFTDSEVHGVIKRMVKQRKDSIEQYEKGGRQDLAEKERAEADLLSSYLPAAMPKESVEALVDEVIKKLSPVTAKDKGRVMGAVMQAVAGQADGSLVREIVEARLK